MALPLGPSRDMRVETREQLHSQLARSQQKSKELKEKLLRSEAMSYLLANHLREHNCEEHKHLIEPVLRKKPQFLEGQLAAELRPVRHHKKRGVQIQEQAQELTQLPRKSREGRALSQLTHQNLQALLTQQDPDSCRRQQLLAELLRLTEHLAGTLSTVDQKSGNQEEPYVDSPHTSGPELKLPQLGQFPISHEANAGPCWPCPPAGPSAVTYLQDCAAGSRCLQREECPIFWAKAMCVCPTVLDPVQPFLCPALPSRPELVVPQMEHFNVPCAANAGPCWLCPMVSLLVSHQVCSGIWDFKHEDQLCRAVGHGGYPMYEEKVAGYLGPPIPKVCLRLPKPEQPEFLLSPVACPYPPLTMPSLVGCTCPTVGSDWGHVQVPHFRLFVSASEYSHGNLVKFLMISLCENRTCTVHSAPLSFSIVLYIKPKAHVIRELYNRVETPSSFSLQPLLPVCPNSCAHHPALTLMSVLKTLLPFQVKIEGLSSETLTWSTRLSPVKGADLTCRIVGETTGIRLSSSASGSAVSLW
uniref:Uncharacterized protein n=1 Tax=Oryctolagus cuniculus TaxID=9986 RepID=A0A5F9C8T7_RABIT